MNNLQEFVDFNPEKEIPSLEDKVIFITGGTAGLGKASAIALAKHYPAHIYFSGRNEEAAASLIAEVQDEKPSVGMTFVKMDMESLASVKKGCGEFSHDRLDILMCNAGVMFIPPGVSKDGFERHFAINHLAHAMIIQQFLPIMTQTAQLPNSDVRIVCLTSTAWNSHPWGGVTFSTLQTPQKRLFGATVRYGQSKLCNVVYASEFARQFPNSNIKAVSAHPGVVSTDMFENVSFIHKLILNIVFIWMGVSCMQLDQGRLSQLWAAAGASKEQLVNGGYYLPVGKLSNDKLSTTGKSEKLARELWDYTEDVLAKF